MPLHLIKLSVGSEDIDDIVNWQAHMRARHGGHYFHDTRMVPRRRDELLAGGSIYWVIKGQIRVRQELRDIEAYEDSAGVRRCRLWLEPALIETRPKPKRPFQGWRYLQPKAAPADLPQGPPGSGDMPASMRAELMELGLL